MPDYKTASQTKDHFQKKLLQEHPEIVSIAPRLKLDADGFPIQEEAVIVIGIKPRNALRLRAGTVAQTQAISIPTELPVIDDQGLTIPNETVEVVIEDEGEILPQMHIVKIRSCPGGYSIGHFKTAVGTLGGVVRIDNTWGYILSNNHVFAATNSGVIGDAIYQPGAADGGGMADTIGNLERLVLIDFRGGLNEVDCALAKVPVPWTRHVRRHVWGIGTPTAVGNATVAQPIRKSGRTTQITNGTIISDNATLQLSYGPGQVAVFVNQLQYTQMTRGGDSGALVWDRDSLTVVGLHFAGSRTTSYGNKIQQVLNHLKQPADRQLSLV